MICASAVSGDGRPLVLLGLTPENLRRLRGGEPILVDLRELGVDARVSITFGQTERALVASLRALGLELPGADDALREVEREHREKGTQP
jgi:hypothetical protein